MSDFGFSDPSIHHVTDMGARYKEFDKSGNFACLRLTFFDANGNEKTFCVFTSDGDLAAMERLKEIGEAIDASSGKKPALHLVDLAQGITDENLHAEEPVS